MEPSVYLDKHFVIGCYKNGVNSSNIWHCKKVPGMYPQFNKVSRSFSTSNPIDVFKMRLEIKI